MSKTIVLIYKLPTLYEILHEINDLLNKLLKDKNPEFGWLSEENEDDKSN